MHHGKFTTAREAVEAHSGEALAERQAFDALPPEQRDAIIEFLWLVMRCLSVSPSSNSITRKNLPSWSSMS